MLNRLPDKSRHESVLVFFPEDIRPPAARSCDPKPPFPPSSLAPTNSSIGCEDEACWSDARVAFRERTLDERVRREVWFVLKAAGRGRSASGVEGDKWRFRGARGAGRLTSTCIVIVGVEYMLV